MVVCLSIPGVFSLELQKGTGEQDFYMTLLCRAMPSLCAGYVPAGGCNALWPGAP